MSETMRHTMRSHNDLSAFMRRRLPNALRLIKTRLLDRSQLEEDAAAARYWAAIGHDMPLHDRAQRLRELGHDAPVIKVHRHPHLTK